MRRVPELDALRGVAAMMVVSHHLGLGPEYPALPMAVHMFFVLSGYLITRIILDRKTHTGFLIPFYARDPADLADLLRCHHRLRPGQFSGSPPAEDARIAVFSHVHAVRAVLLVLAASAILQVLLLTYLDVGRRRAVLSPLAFSCDVAGPPDPPRDDPGPDRLVVRGAALVRADASRHRTGMDSDSGPCLPGCWASPVRLDRAGGESSGGWRRSGRPCLPTRLSAGPSKVGFCASGERRADTGVVAQYEPDGLALWRRRRAGHLLLGPPAPAPLRNKALCYLGTISYGLYFYHFPLYALISPSHYRPNCTDSMALDGLKLAASVALAVVSWEFIEKPILRLKDRFPYPAPTQGDPDPEVGPHFAPPLPHFLLRPSETRGRRPSLTARQTHVGIGSPMLRVIPRAVTLKVPVVSGETTRRRQRIVRVALSPIFALLAGSPDLLRRADCGDEHACRRARSRSGRRAARPSSSVTATSGAAGL